jgi:hypothetical protein
LKRQLYTLLIFSLLTASVYGQTMVAIFRELPPDCTPDLSTSERDSLLVNGEYIMPDGDSIETTKYDIDTSTAKNYLRYEFSFTTGQSGFIIFELRSFSTIDGGRIIIFSRYGGLSRAYEQQDLKVFRLKNHILLEDTKQTLLPETINTVAFMKKNIPEKIKKKIEQAVNSCYDLNPEGSRGIAFTIFAQSPIDEYEQWVRGYTMYFTWNGVSFDKKIKPGL